MSRNPDHYEMKEHVIKIMELLDKYKPSLELDQAMIKLQEFLMWLEKADI